MQHSRSYVQLAENAGVMMTGKRRILWQGIIAGTIGFAVVAIALALSNLIAGHPMLTTAYQLGSALEGAPGDATGRITAGPVLTYSAVHLLVFLAFGLIASGLMVLAERGQQLWYLSLFIMIFFSFHLFAAVQVLAVPTGAALPAPVIWIAGVLASLAMIGYLLPRHPAVRQPQPW